ncbi:MAG: alpha/beta hydrolase [Alphaproteobacteria bacterium]
MTDIVFEEYQAHKGDVTLQMYRRRPAGGDAPVLFLVHGSSFSARSSYDLEVPGHPGYSLMEAFAKFGYDVWTVDHEGYGRSTHTESSSDIACGVEDLKVTAEVVEQETGQKSAIYFGQSSGALRAGAFANACPERVSKIIFAALTYTGKDSPTLIKRAERLEEWKNNPRRIVDEEYYRGVFTRDVTGLTISELAPAAAKSEMDNGGGSVPNGTYYDMCANLPVVEPEKIVCPVLIVRGDHDGIATDEDVMDFFGRLPHRDKQLVSISGMAHNTQLGVNRARFWHAMKSFLDMPDRVDSLA